VQAQKTAYENAKRERETLFALIAEKEQQIEGLKAQEERIVLAYHRAQADRSSISHAMYEGERLQEEVERLKQKEEIEQNIRQRKAEVESEEAEIAREEELLSEKRARYTECIRKKERLTEIYHQGIGLEKQERELKEELRAAGLQAVKMQSVESMRLRYAELMAEYARVAADSEADPKDVQDRLEKIEKEALSEKATMELLLEQMGIRVIPGAQPPALTQFRERRNAIETALNDVLEQIDVLVKEQEECLLAREEAEKLAKEIEKEHEQLAMRTEKCQRMKTELVKMQQLVQEILLETSYSSSAEAEDALQRFIKEQEEKKKFIDHAEDEYEEWQQSFQEETAMLDQLYGQRLIQMQKEQLAMEEYNKSLRNSQQ